MAEFVVQLTSESIVTGVPFGITMISNSERSWSAMIYDLQKASLLKRLSAFVLDAILLCVLAVGVGFVLSAVCDFDSYSQGMEASYSKYEQEFGVSFDVTQEEYDKMTEAQIKRLDEAFAALSKDEEAVYYYNMLMTMTLMIMSSSILLAMLLLEFVVPLLFGNGQTVGKKVFGIGLMKVTGIKINAQSLFVRTMLGKYTIETMIPVLLMLMTMFGIVGMMAPIVICGILILQVVVMATSRKNAMIHDVLAQTVAVDLASQMIFGNEAQMLEYQKRAHEQMVKRQTY